MVYDKRGRHEAIPDGLWIIALSKYGWFGLCMLTMTLLLPSFLLARKVPKHWLGSAAMAPAALLGVLASLYMIDCLLNAMINPVFTIAVGGLAAYTAALNDPARRAVARMPQRRGLGLPATQPVAP